MSDAKPSQAGTWSRFAVGVAVRLLLAPFAFGCTAEKASSSAGVGTAPVAAASKADARAVVDRAVRAHGKNLLEGNWSGRLVVLTRGHVSAAARDELLSTTVFQFPDRLREVVDAETILADRKQTAKWTYVRNGKEAWRDDGDGALKPSTELQSIDDVFPLNLLRDLRARRDGRLTVQIAGSDASGTRLLVGSADREGPPPSEVTFDPATGLISGIVTIDHNPRTGRIGKSETRFSNYGDFLGARLPKTMTTHLDGELFVEKTLQELTALSGVDPAEFQPQ
jgi:hypothetical protein